MQVDAGSNGEHPQFGLHCIIDIATYNSLDKLIGVTGHVLHFIYNVKHFSSRMSGPLSSQELTKVKLAWIGDCQRKSYGKEIDHLTSKPNNRLPLVRQLHLFLDKNHQRQDP